MSLFRRLVQMFGGDLEQGGSTSRDPVSGARIVAACLRRLGTGGYGKVIADRHGFSEGILRDRLPRFCRLLRWVTTSCPSSGIMLYNAVSCPKTARSARISSCGGHRAVGHTDMPIEGLIDRQIYRLFRFFFLKQNTSSRDSTSSPDSN